MGTSVFSASASSSAGRGASKHVSCGFLLTVLLFAQSLMLVTSEIFEMDMIIAADSDEVHFVRGYLQAPASINLSNLRLISNEFVVFDDEFTVDYELDEDDYATDDAYESQTQVPSSDKHIDDIKPTDGVRVPPTTTPSEENTDEIIIPSGGGNFTEDEPTTGKGNVDKNGSGSATENPNDEGKETATITPSSSEESESSPSSSPGKASGNEESESSPSSSPGKASGNEESESSPSSSPGKASGDEESESSPSTTAPTAKTSSQGGDRSLQKDNKTKGSTSKQIMEIVLFTIPSDCEKDFWGNCDWVTLGVGAYDDEMDGGLSYCCSRDTAERGICDSDAVGTLFVNHSLFKGDHRKIDVPSQPLQDFKMDDPNFDIKESGDYVMVIANCNDDGLGVITLGTMEWKSAGGYLPGDIFGLMFFFAGMSGVYLVLVLWYYVGMKMFQEAAIPIQKYILAALVLGLFEASFQAINLYIWNVTGTQSAFVVYTGLGLKILEHGFSRCLGVMVAMGWGVVRDSLGSSLFKIVFLGILYSGSVFGRDFLGLIAESVNSVSLSEKEELIDLALVLSTVAIFIDIIFFWWIMYSLRSTAEYLKNMNQTTKLRRHLRLRCLIMTSLLIIFVLLGVTVAQFFIIFLNKEQMWILQAVGHGNYFFVLFGVAILWRPNADAKNYVMQMEVPAVGEGDNDLELSCVVPSAEDMDFDDEFKVDGAIAT